MSTHTDSSASAPAAGARVELAVDGMTCASCAARIEKKLNRLDGVTATVNFATGTAAVSYDPAVHRPPSMSAARPRGCPDRVRSTLRPRCEGSSVLVMKVL